MIDPSRKRGFATLSPAQRIAVSRMGGKVKVSKGFAGLTPEERVTNGKRAAQIRWAKRKEQDGQDSIPNRDESIL